MKLKPVWYPDLESPLKLHIEGKTDVYMNITKTEIKLLINSNRHIDTQFSYWYHFKTVSLIQI
jgi:hypothetical protein